MLDGVDLKSAPRGKVENDDVGIVTGGFFDFLKNSCAFGIIGGAASGEYK